MSFLIKLLGGYTKQEYKELKQKYENEIITKQDLENRLDNLKVENEKVLKANETLIRDNMKLKNQLAAIEQSDHMPEEKQWYYMYNSFEGLFYTANGVRYLDGHKLIEQHDNSFNVIYNRIWAEDANKKVTFKEFNDELTKLIINRDSDLLPEYVKMQLDSVDDHTTSIEPDKVHKYAYNEDGILCYRSGMHPVYK